MLESNENRETASSNNTDAERYSLSAFAKMNSFRKRGKLCDIVVKVGGREFPAHRVVLAASSDYFDAMFSSGMTESAQLEVELKSVSPQVMEALLDFMYTGQVRVNMENVQDLLPAASLVQMEGVKAVCSAFLFNEVDSSNVLGIRRFAELHSCNDLETYAKTYAAHNFQTVIEHEEFSFLTAEEIIELLDREDLQVDNEETAFRASMKWIYQDVAERAPYLPNILNNLRLATMSVRFLTDVVDAQALVRLSLECRDLVDEAKRFHLRPDLRSQMRSRRFRQRNGGDEYLVVIGGFGSYQSPSDSVEMFNPRSRVWSELPSLPISYRYVAACSLGTCVYVIGGFDGGERLNTVGLLDVSQRESGWRWLTPMHYRRGLSAACTHKGLIYVCGGFDGQTRLRALEVYHPKIAEWRILQEMNTAREGSGLVVADDCLYCLGGYDGFQLLNSMESFDLRLGTWTVCKPMYMRRSGAGCAVLGDTIYVCGGYGGAEGRGPLHLDTVEAYNTRLAQWTLVSSMNVPRCYIGACQLGGRICVAAGYNGSRLLNTIESYDPVENSWTLYEESRMHNERCDTGMCVVRFLTHAESAATLPGGGGDSTGGGNSRGSSPGGGDAGGSGSAATTAGIGNTGIVLPGLCSSHSDSISASMRYSRHEPLASHRGDSYSTRYSSAAAVHRISYPHRHFSTTAGFDHQGNFQSQAQVVAHAYQPTLPVAHPGSSQSVIRERRPRLGDCSQVGYGPLTSLRPLTTRISISPQQAYRRHQDPCRWSVLNRRLRTPADVSELPGTVGIESEAALTVIPGHSLGEEGSMTVENLVGGSGHLHDFIEDDFPAVEEGNPDILRPSLHSNTTPDATHFRGMFDAVNSTPFTCTNSPNNMASMTPPMRSSSDAVGEDAPGTEIMSFTACTSVLADQLPLAHQSGSLNQTLASFAFPSVARTTTLVNDIFASTGRDSSLNFTEPTDGLINDELFEDRDLISLPQEYTNSFIEEITESVAGVFLDDDDEADDGEDEENAHSNNNSCAEVANYTDGVSQLEVTCIENGEGVVKVNTITGEDSSQSDPCDFVVTQTGEVNRLNCLELEEISLTHEEHLLPSTTSFLNRLAVMQQTMDDLPSSSTFISNRVDGHHSSSFSSVSSTFPITLENVSRESENFSHVSMDMPMATITRHHPQPPTASCSAYSLAGECTGTAMLSYQDVRFMSQPVLAPGSVAPVLIGQQSRRPSSVVAASSVYNSHSAQPFLYTSPAERPGNDAETGGALNQHHPLAVGQSVRCPNAIDVDTTVLHANADDEVIMTSNHEDLSLSLAQRLPPSGDAVDTRSDGEGEEGENPLATGGHTNISIADIVAMPGLQLRTPVGETSVSAESLD